MYLFRCRAAAALQTVNAGAELTRGLVGSARFGLRVMADAEHAFATVRRGDLAFAIVIPADFSAIAVPGVLPGAGKVVVIVSVGNNHASAGLARRFAEDLGHQAHETRNEQRWARVLQTANKRQCRRTLFYILGPSW